MWQSVTITPMLKIGLTGGIGSGKSTAAKFFADLGITIIDADIIAYDLVVKGSEAFEKIVAKFGAELIRSNGELDRKHLREIVFHDAAAKKWLEELLHPLVIKEIQRKSEVALSEYCVIVIPLLLENQLQYLVDRILVVDLPEEEQVIRAVQRDNVTEEDVLAIIKTQVSRSERIAEADDIISNNEDPEYLRQQVLDLHKKYLRIKTV